MGAFAARPLAGPVHVGALQSTLTHALYRLRPLPPAEYDGRLVDHGQYADRGNLLCTVRWSRHHTYTVVRHVEAPLPGEGECGRQVTCPRGVNHVLSETIVLS